MANDIVLRPSYWASVSGGKDSLFMLWHILQNLDRFPLDGVVHFELEIDYPFIKDVVNYMESECKRFNIPFIRISPRVSYYEYLARYGLPTRQARWCNNPYKLDSSKQLEEFLLSRGEQLVFYIGYCFDESYRYEKRLNSRIKEIYPLVVDRILESDILAWAKHQDIFNSYYRFNRRCGCMFCPMADRKQLAYLKVFYPSEFAWFISQAFLKEKVVSEKLGRPFSYWSSNPKYNTDYIVKNIDEKYLMDINQVSFDDIFPDHNEAGFGGGFM